MSKSFEIENHHNTKSPGLINERDFLSKKETTRIIEPNLVKLGVEPGKTVLIHSSFSSLSRQGFHAETFLESILDFIGSGTLTLPAMSWREVSPLNNIFSELDTKSNVGILSEVFRLKYAERRSIHPTHSVASIGSNTDFLLKDHYLDIRPCSELSPWGRLEQVDAQIILIGVDMDNCTIVHHLEETRAPDIYLREDVEKYLCITRNGVTQEVTTRRHNKLYRNFYKFRDKLTTSHQLNTVDVGDCCIYGFKAKDLVSCISQEFDKTLYATIATSGERSKLM